MSYESVGDEVSAQTEADMADYAAIMAPQSSFKPLAQITKVSEAAAYAANGYQISAKKRWESAAAAYFDVFQKARHGERLDNLKTQLARADKIADAARQAVSTRPIVPSNENEVPEHIKSAGFLGGIPWWAMVGAAGAVYFLLNKKGRKTGRKRARRKARKVYRRRR